MHQVQEELEKYFLDNKSQLERVMLLEKDLAAQKDTAAKTAGELKKAQEQVKENSFILMAPNTSVRLANSNKSDKILIIK